MSQVNTVVFDIGNVLLDWDPRHLYRKLIEDEARREWFLREVCPPLWNLELDRGRDWDEAIEERIALFPQEADNIRAFRDRWPEMVHGAITPSVELFARLRAAGVTIHGLTNFAAPTFKLAQARFDFLTWFEHVVVSGEVKLVKPDPAIFHLLVEKTGLTPANTLFIDDSRPNIEAADGLGFRTHHFTGAERLREELVALGLLPH